MIYLLIILFIGGVGGYLVSEKVDEWRGSKAAAKTETAKAEDLTATINGLLNHEKTAYQDHDADELLDDCASNYLEVDGNTGETMDLARARLYYRQYFHDGQAIKLDFGNVQISTLPNSVVAQADYTKASNAFTAKNIRGFKGHGTWVFVRQNSIWLLASYAWSESPY